MNGSLIWSISQLFLTQDNDPGWRPVWSGILVLVSHEPAVSGRLYLHQAGPGPACPEIPTLQLTEPFNSFLLYLYFASITSALPTSEVRCLLS